MKNLLKACAALLPAMWLNAALALGQPAKRKMPNILIILTDDQGLHDVSYYGTPDIRTPNIDGLVAGGMRFDNFYANSTVCSPTRASLMTGKYPDRAGVPGVVRTHPESSWGFLDPQAVLLPEVLRTKGYRTALIGKWHLGLERPNLPQLRGFDTFKGWLADMMDDYVEKRRHGINYMRENDSIIDPPGHATDLFAQWSVDYIRESEKHASPFFLYLAFNAPHFPVQPPEDWLGRVRNRKLGVSEKRERLVAHIEHLDHAIGKVVQELKNTGQYDNTIIVFTSDNGGFLSDGANNGPYRGGKEHMYEGGLRVPTGIAWESRMKAGQSSNYRAMTMDIFPTLLDLIGKSEETDMDGKSFAKILLGGSMGEERPLYFMRREGWETYGGLTIQALQHDGWKLLQNGPYEALQLFNLAEDPYEQKDLIGAYPEKKKELLKMLMEHLQKGGQIPWQPKNLIEKERNEQENEKTKF